MSRLRSRLEKLEHAGDGRSAGPRCAVVNWRLPVEGEGSAAYVAHVLEQTGLSDCAIWIDASGVSERPVVAVQPQHMNDMSDEDFALFSAALEPGPRGVITSEGFTDMPQGFEAWWDETFPNDEGVSHGR